MALSLLACLAAACNDEPTDLPALSREGYLELNFSVPETRADLDASGAGNFSEGDRIGLYIDNGSKVEYRELTYTSGAWEPRLLRSDFGDGSLTLAAHYPAWSSVAEKPEQAFFSLSGDQSGDGFAASDLLFSRKSLAAGENRAEMIFSHALHRLRAEISGADVSAVKVRSRMTGTVNLLTGAVTAAEDSFGWITPRKNPDGSYEAVILPQAATAFRDAEGLLKITTAKGEITYKAPNEVDGQALEAFLAGQQLTLKLSLKESEETVDPEPPVVTEWTNKKMWVYGITAPVWEEGDPNWKQAFAPFYLTYYLPWKAEYGWYDCNKTDPTNNDPNDYSDGSMCWAASVSNLLHWWFAQNKSYIDRYGDRYKGPDYHYPLQKAQESDIFQCFIDAFINEGGFGEQGVNWFINGDIPTGPMRRPPYNDAGYFKEVFGDVRLGEDIGGMGRTKFNETIKDALTNRKALAISTGDARSGHMMTIWGAEFDEEGYVSYIYMADNNDRDYFESDGIGIGRYPIVYNLTTVSTGYLTGYDGDEDGQIDTGKSINIKGLTTISLGQEQWEAFFRQHPEL